MKRALGMTLAPWLPIQILILIHQTTDTLSHGLQEIATKPVDLSDEWTTALRDHDKLKVKILLSVPCELTDGAYNKSLMAERLLTQIRSYYKEIISNQTYVDHVGAFEKLYTFYADSMFLLPPSETVFADKWFTMRQSYSVTPVSAASFLWLDAAHANMTMVKRGLARIQEFVKHALPILHDLGHTERDTQKLKRLAASFLAISAFDHPADLCNQSKMAINSFYETWSREE